MIMNILEPLMKYGGYLDPTLRDMYGYHQSLKQQDAQRQAAEAQRTKAMQYLQSVQQEMMGRKGTGTQAEQAARQRNMAFLKRGMDYDPKATADALFKMRTPGSTDSIIDNRLGKYDVSRGAYIDPEAHSLARDKERIANLRASFDAEKAAFEGKTWTDSAGIRKYVGTNEPVDKEAAARQLRRKEIQAGAQPLPTSVQQQKLQIALGNMGLVTSVGEDGKLKATPIEGSLEDLKRKERAAQKEAQKERSHWVGENMAFKRATIRDQITEWEKSPLTGDNILGAMYRGVGKYAWETDPYNFSSYINAYKEAMSLANIEQMKANGMTFGSLTEGERLAAGLAITGLREGMPLDEMKRILDVMEYVEAKLFGLPLPAKSMKDMVGKLDMKDMSTEELLRYKKILEGNK